MLISACIIVIDRKSLTIIQRRLLKIGATSKENARTMEKEILDVAKNLFMSKGYEETSISDIMETVGAQRNVLSLFSKQGRSYACIRQSNVL